MTDRVRPFYCGSQGGDWKCANCDECKKGYNYITKTWHCEIEEALDGAYMDDGSVARDIAERMGLSNDVTVYNWRCKEFVKDDAPEKRYPPSLATAAKDKPAPWIEEFFAKKGIKL